MEEGKRPGGPSNAEIGVWVLVGACVLTWLMLFIFS
jgi:hypothetical protein